MVLWAESMLALCTTSSIIAAADQGAESFYALFLSPAEIFLAVLKGTVQGLPSHFIETGSAQRRQKKRMEKTVAQLPAHLLASLIVVDSQDALKQADTVLQEV